MIAIDRAILIIGDPSRLSANDRLKSRCTTLLVLFSGFLTLIAERFIRVTDVLLRVGTIVATYPVLVARNLTQSCILGADFLKKYGFIIDLCAGTVTAGHTLGGGPSDVAHSRNHAINVCHVTCMETTVILGYSQI